MEAQEDSLDLRRYLEILLRWWWVIALAIAATSLVGYLMSSNQTPLYRAQATILVQQSQSTAPTFGDVQASQQLAWTYQEIMTTRPLLQKVIDQLGLPYSVGGLRGMVGTSVVPNTPLMSVEARSEDPQLAATIANTLAEIFIQETQSSRLADIARLQALAEAQGAVGGEGLLRAQLGTLGSLTIVEPAIVPGGPFRPQVLRTTLIMVLPGILLGLVLMAGLEYFNRSLPSPTCPRP